MSAFLKNLPVRYLAAFVYLSETPDPSPPAVIHCMNTNLCTYSHREGEEGVGEPVRRLEAVRGALVFENTNMSDSISSL
jgi:hypothetical protein